MLVPYERIRAALKNDGLVFDLRQRQGKFLYNFEKGIAVRARHPLVEHCLVVIKTNGFAAGRACRSLHLVLLGPDPQGDAQRP